MVAPMNAALTAVLNLIIDLSPGVAGQVMGALRPAGLALRETINVGLVGPERQEDKGKPLSIR